MSAEKNSAAPDAFVLQRRRADGGTRRSATGVFATKPTC